MAKYGTNYEVINAFADGHETPHTNGQSTIYFDLCPTRKYDVIYSYGSHFPMCYRFYAEHKIYKRHLTLHIVNGDGYSPTTSQHQSMLLQALKDKESFTTSFDALRSARINITACTVIDYTQDQSKYASHWNDEETYTPIQEQDIPRGAAIRRDKHGTIVSWHLAASMLLRSGRRYYLCGMDDDSYFVSRLPRKVETVEAAIESLKPKRILDAESKGLQIERQGEWFCIKHCNGKEAKQIYKMMHKDFVLPLEGPGSNTHTVTRGYKKSSRVYFSGSMMHSEHKTLRVSLAKAPEIWEAIKNTAKGSWSTQGVD